jgi:hypothetical protein
VSLIFSKTPDLIITSHMTAFSFYAAIQTSVSGAVEQKGTVDKAEICQKPYLATRVKSS